MKKRILSLALALAIVFSLCCMGIPAAAAESYLWPVPSSKSTSQGYTSGHKALDITASGGASIAATKSGTVFMVYSGCNNSHAASKNGKDCTTSTCSPNCGIYYNDDYGKYVCNWGYGNGVIIKHSDGSGYSMYAHMKTLNVKKGATVKQGDVIGTMGSSGCSTGTHLHFEVTSTIATNRGTYYPATANFKISSYIYTPGETVAPASPVTVVPTTDSTYLAKAYIKNTDACVVTKITKPAGSNVTKSGLYLYDADGSLIKKATFDITGVVGKNTTSFHSWYEMNSEIGVTLSSGTTYKYKFFVVVDGVTYEGQTYSFTTTGPTPVKYYDLTFEYSSAAVTGTSVEAGKAIGYVPEGAPEDGYSFQGWYTGRDGTGTRITADTVYNFGKDIVVYPYYTKDPEPTPTPNPTPAPTPSPAPVENVLMLQINNPYLTLNGSDAPIDGQGTTPVIRDSRTLLPVRAVMEAMGGEVGWDAANRIVSLRLDGVILYLQIDSLTSWDSRGSVFDLDSAPRIINSRTMLPIRFVVEYFGGEVGWDNTSKTVTIKF